MKDLDLIYFTARELPPEDRPAYLTRVCEGDQVLRRRVEQMLAVSAEAESFVTDLPEAELEKRKPGREAVKDLKPGIADVPDEVIGQKIGRYKILERVGEGGCGVVYVAEQTEPIRRRVALKVIKLGMDTKQVVARFEAERQALAMMDHPNIARVLDAGTTETGRPYFIMELVRGIKITDYCDQNNLPTTERLDLFLQVCHAIQHAHQKGIIHRDIKPSNILVTLRDGVPVPKVIDFGIAKAIEGRLTDATVYTQLHHFIGTPAYMSPEQAEMSALDVDTRSDIYSLGVLLYELLTGRPPFDPQELMSLGLDEMRRTIREKEPPRPSTKLTQTLAAAGMSPRKTTSGLAIPTQEEVSADSRRRLRLKEQIARVRGDLDWIVMKCLEKDRTRRYETANGLAMDLQRHLSDEPVLARPPSRLYEFQKTVRRHKFGFSAAAGLFLVLAAGVLTSTWQAVEATRARQAEVKQRIAAQEAQAQAAAQQQKAERERHRAEAQLARAERLVYASKLMLAQSDFEADNGGLALHYLDECQPNLRGWEWRYLWTRINARQTLVGHSHKVSSVAISPDAHNIVTGSQDGTAKVWDAATGQELFTLTGHRGLIMSVAFSSDGQRIVTGGGPWGEGKKPGEVKVWNAETGRELLDLKGHDYCVWSVAFSPDGQRIVSGGGDWAYGPGELKVWDAGTGQEVLIHTEHAGCVRSASFSPDGKRIVTGSFDGKAVVWDARTGREILSLDLNGGSVHSVAFSPDGQRIVTGSENRTANVWDALTGQELFALAGHTKWVTSVAFSPDGRRIITGSADQTAKVWDAADGKEVFTIKGHTGYVRSVAFSPDGNHIVTGSDDQTAKVWDAKRGQEVPILKGHGDFISSIAFSPGGQRMVTGSGDGTAKVWDTATSREVLTLGSNNNGIWTESGLWGVAFSPDGQRIVTGSNDKTARIWDTETGRELLVLQHSNVVYSVTFSPDGRWILTGGGHWGGPMDKSGEIKLWNAASGKELFTLQDPGAVAVWGVAFSPDGQRIVTSSVDGTAKVWEAATGRKLLSLPPRNSDHNSVWSVAFSPDGRRIVTGGWKIAKVWDAGTGEQLLVLKGHTGNVRSVTFSPDGQRIVSGSDDRSAKIWDAASGQEVLSLKGFADSVLSLAFSPDGKRMATGIAGANATAKVWYAEPPTKTGR